MNTLGWIELERQTLHTDKLEIKQRMVKTTRHRADLPARTSRTWTNPYTWIPNPVVCGLLDTVHSTHESEAPTIFQQSYTLAQLQPMVDFLTNYADGLSSECFFNTPLSLSGPSTKENIHVDLHDHFFSMPAER